MSAYKPHILVVDDSPLMRRQILADLSEFDATTQEAEHGLDAIAKVAQRKPDLITLDIEMPKMDGYGVCRVLSANASTLGIPVIMISSKPDEAERLRSMEAGAVEYFNKPFDPGTLRQLAHTLLARVTANRTKRVFSVIADAGVQKQINASLLRNGYLHRVFADVDGLIEALRQDSCSLLLLDFHLPERGAYRILDALKRLPPGTTPKVIALVATAARRDLVNAFYSGATDFVRVPFYSEELIARVERQLDVQTEEAELRDLATVDALTRVANRGELMRRSAVEVGRSIRDRTALGVLVVDVDHFKRVNDTQGHAVGDQVLRAVAKELTGRIRDTDFIGRYGGEEFVVLLPGATREAVSNIAERLRSQVQELKIDGPDGPIHVTVSIGGRTWPHELLSTQLDFAVLIEEADQALYNAKSSGRNRCCIDVATSDDAVVPSASSTRSVQDPSPSESQLGAKTDQQLQSL
ncbi:MAG TPA: diguanylate cyclase [Polyangiaceae bacterium]|jgi:two-component system cell cycle response regulator|nr:diguanylate cyclase [Polyangiaceae bacterium]